MIATRMAALSEFRSRLEAETWMQTGRPFHIFQDRNDVGWGQQWRQRMEESLDAATFLIPIVTPAFFNSTHCRDEFERFLEHEQKLGQQRSDSSSILRRLSHPERRNSTPG